MGERLVEARDVRGGERAGVKPDGFDEILRAGGGLRRVDVGERIGERDIGGKHQDQNGERAFHAPPPPRHSAGRSLRAAAIPCPARADARQRDEIAPLRRDRQLVQELAAACRHDRLHQDGEMADGFGQDIKHRAHARRVGLRATPRAPARRHSGWPPPPPARWLRARGGTPARRIRRAASPSRSRAAASSASSAGQSAPGSGHPAARNCG